MQFPKLGDDSYYDGSRLFAWLADFCGLSVDLVNFLISQFLALLLASIFRSLLHPSKVSAGVRHAFGLVLGLCFGYFCFGQQAIHIAGLPAICYIVIRTQNPQIVQRMVMVVALGYLSCIHLHRQYYDYGSYSLDITGPLMIITQKMTSLAFSIHDGLSREEKELTKNQQYHAIQKLPSALEFFSYALHFQGLMAGPMVFYRDYIEFIEGYHILKHAPGTNGNLNKNYNSKQIVLEPSPVKVVVRKVVASLVCAFIFMKFITVYPIKGIKDDDFVENSSIFYKFWYIMMATTCIRFKYYHAWLLADAICNNSGLGFNGFEKDGSAKWDMISNIDVLNFEFGTNFRDCINSWNMGTNRWLRTIVYERVPKKYGTPLTFGLSALWHGFYAGYYLTFANGALIVLAARSARRLFRFRFQSTLFMRRFYDLLTCLWTRLFMGYATFPFVLLEFQASLRLYLKIYMCLHLVALVTVFVLPKLIRGEKRKEPTSIAVYKKETTVICDEINDSDITKTGSNTKIKTTIINRQFSMNADNRNDNANDDGNDINIKETINLITTEQINLNDTNDDKEPENLSYLIRKNLEILPDAKNLEEFFDKTVTGIVELKHDLMRLNEDNELYLMTSDGLRKRQSDLKHSFSNNNASDGVDAFIKKEIDALNAAVQQANVIPAVLSNGHAK